MGNNPEETNFSRLIADLKAWNQGASEGTGISVTTWIHLIGNYEHAIGYAQLFWPHFIQHEGCIFRAEAFDQATYNSCMRVTGGNKRTVEHLQNHLHIRDIFMNTENEPTRDVIVYFGNLLKEMWEAKLGRDFPDKPIVVSFPDEFQEDLLDYQITFFQQSHD